MSCVQRSHSQRAASAGQSARQSPAKRRALLNLNEEDLYTARSPMRWNRMDQNGNPRSAASESFANGSVTVSATSRRTRGSMSRRRAATQGGYSAARRTTDSRGNTHHSVSTRGGQRHYFGVDDEDDDDDAEFLDDVFDTHTREHVSAVRESRSKFLRDSSRKYVRLVVRECQDVIPRGRASPPTTFLAIQTSTSKGKTFTVRDSASPIFNQEFFIPVNDPNTDTLTLTCVAVTPYGNRKLSECVISFKTLERGAMRLFRVPLVHRAGRFNARERGEVAFTMSTDDFDTAATISHQEEDHFRRRVRRLLLRNAPNELHRLEWFVANYATSPNGLEVLAETYHKPLENFAAVLLTVKEVRGLTDAKDTPTTCETCYVKLKSTDVKLQTKVVSYSRRAAVDQTFSLALAYPERDSVELSVFSGNYKHGSCLVSAAGVYRGRPREVTCFLVRNAGTQQATLCGEVVVVLRSKASAPQRVEANGQRVSLGAREEQATRDRQRIANYMWRYNPSDLHRVDVIAATAPDVGAYIRSLVPRYGPESLKHELVLTVERGVNLTRSGEKLQQNTGANGARALRVVARVGMVQVATSPAKSLGEWAFAEALTIPVSFPGEEELVVIVQEVLSNRDVEISRAVLSMRNLLREQVVNRTVSVIANAQTCSATGQGHLHLKILAKDFGLDTPLIDANREKYMRARLDALIARYHPEQLHCVEFMLGDSVGHEEELLKQLIAEYGPEIGSAPMTIRVLGIRNFVPACSCYVKGYLNGEPVLRTNDHYGAVDVKFDISFKNEVAVPLENPQLTQLRFKIAQHTLLGSASLAHVDVSLRTMVRDVPNVCWLPFFGKDNEPLGELGLELTSTGFVRFPSKKIQRRNAHGFTMLDEVIRDVTTLVRKLRPEELGNVQPLIAQASSVEMAHAELRDQLAPKRVVASMYISVDSVDLIDPTDKESALRGAVRVSASFGDEVGTTSPRTLWASNIINEKTYFPTIRLDIPETDMPPRRGGKLVSTGLELSVDLDAAQVAERSKTPRRAASVSPRAVSQRGQRVGKVLLSLRALLTRELFDNGEPITVDLVDVDRLQRQENCKRGVSMSDPWVEGSTDASKVIVGKITFRASLPAFEQIPYWLHFNPRKMLRVSRPYIRYFENRIAAMMRAYEPAQLYDFHQNMYERDVATNRWAISLYDWLVALIKRNGPERDAFGPAPRLPFNPEAEEMKRNMAVSGRRRRESATNGARDTSLGRGGTDDTVVDEDEEELYEGFRFDEWYDEEEALERSQMTNRRWGRNKVNGAAGSPSPSKSNASRATSRVRAERVAATSPQWQSLVSF